MHHGGVGSRLKDAAKFGLRSLLLSGGNPLYALGAGVGAFVNPQAEHDQKYNREMASWQPTAEAEMDVIKKSNAGKIQQGEAQNKYYDNLTARERIIDSRTGRAERASDRQRGIQDTEQQRRHAQAKDVFDAAFKTGQPIPESLRGSAYEPWIGKTLKPHERDRITAITDAQTGEVSRLNLDTGERLPVEGVTGRTQRPEGEGPTGNDRANAELRARQRVAKEYTGTHTQEMIDQRAEGIYSTLAQKAGITWKDEQAGDDDDNAKGPLIRQLRAQAQRDAKDIVERDLKALHEKYTEEELGTVQKNSTAGQRVGKKGPLDR